MRKERKGGAGRGRTLVMDRATGGKMLFFRSIQMRVLLVAHRFRPPARRYMIAHRDERFKKEREFTANCYSMVHCNVQDGGLPCPR